MSDNQSENSADWGLTPGTEANWSEQFVKQTQEAIWQAEEALEEAKRAHIIAKGRHAFETRKPTWRQILCPGVNINRDKLYTMCTQLGYSFALWEGKIWAAGQPSEQMMDTSLTEADIK